MPRSIMPAAILSLAIVFGGLVSFAGENGLSQYTAAKIPVKVFLKDFSNESGQSQVAEIDLKEAVAAALENRRSVRFEVVKSPQESDVEISGVIKEYKYMERGPLKPKSALPLTAIDAVATATHNYVEMQVEFVIVDSKTRLEVWRDRVNDFIKRVMTPAESIPLIHEKISRTFLGKSFGNPKGSAAY